MLLEDGLLAHLRICNIAVSPSIVDCVVLELIGPLVMLAFDFVRGSAVRIDIQGRSGFIQNRGITFQTEQTSKKSVRRAGSFQFTLRNFSSAD
jgi:hypothetical protein